MEKASYIAAADIRASFYHDEVPQHAADLYVFRYKNALYQLTRKAMGIVPAPEHQQIVSQALFRTSSTVNVHIDNALFMSADRSTIETDVCTIKQRAHKANIELNPGCEVSTKSDYWGANIDVEQKTITLTQRTVQKLTAALSDAMADGRTVREVFRLYGRIFNATGILEHPLDKYFYAIKFYRMLSRRFCPNGIGVGYSCSNLEQCKRPAKELGDIHSAAQCMAQLQYCSDSASNPVHRCIPHWVGSSIAHQ